MKANYYHLTINARDYGRSLRFYKDLFSYLGWRVGKEGARHAVFFEDPDRVKLEVVYL